jgi:dTDP-4-dehydrorhamnose 3,5-epimerase-like enzyme
MNHLYKIIPFAVKHGNCSGSLVQFQPGDEPENALPFSIGKVLVSSDMQPEDVRGNHAHYETEEIVVALSGGCTFELDDGRGRKAVVRLSATEVRDQRSEIKSQGSDARKIASDHRSPTSDFCTSNPKPQTSNREEIKEALLLFPHVWRTFYDFEPGTVLLVVANMLYDESDYIREREEFERIAQRWKGLGGSAER